MCGRTLSEGTETVCRFCVSPQAVVLPDRDRIRKLKFIMEMTGLLRAFGSGMYGTALRHDRVGTKGIHKLIQTSPGRRRRMFDRKPA
jgi:hypothetical protein